MQITFPSIQTSVLLIASALFACPLRADDKADAGEKRLHAVEDRLAALAKTLGSIQQRVQQQTKDCREAQEKLTQALAERKQAQTQADAANKEVKRLQKLVDAGGKGNGAPQKSLTEAQARAKALSDEVAKLKDDNTALAALAEKSKMLQAKVEELSSAQSRLTAQLGEKQTLLDEALAGRTKAESQVLQYEASMAKQSAEEQPKSEAPPAPGPAPLEIAPIFYGANDDNIGREKQRVLASVRSILTSEPNATIEINGHSSGEGNPEANMLLSARRAQSIADYLTGNGIPSGQLRIVAQGDTTPLADNSTLEGRRKNRRVDFNVLTAPKAQKVEGRE